MSGGYACTCVKPTKARGPIRLGYNLEGWQREHWEVIHRRCNHSAFNGHRRTNSLYSSVHCKKCGHVWRTKAHYVMGLPDRSTSQPQEPKP